MGPSDQSSSPARPLLPDLGYTRSFWEKVPRLMPSRKIFTGIFQIQQMFLEGLPRVLTRIKC